MAKFLSGFILALTLSACGGLSIIALSNRTLYIGNDGRLFHNHCAKKSMFGNCKEFKTDYYNLSDSSTRLKLKDFVCVNKFRQF